MAYELWKHVEIITSYMTIKFLLSEITFTWDVGF